MDADEEADERVGQAARGLVEPVKPFSAEGYAIVGAAFEVHRELGGGLLEEVYQQALEIEFELRAIPFLIDEQLRIFYKDRLLHKRYTPDLSCLRSNPR